MALPFAGHVETDLIARVRAGDESAFAELFQQYFRPLCIYAARVHTTAGTSEEIVQEIFFRIWMHRDRLIVTGSISGYLYTAVRNFAINQSQRAQSEHRWQQAKWAEATDERVESQPADEDVRAAELAAAIDRAVAQLPPRCRQAFILRRQHHLSYAEIAQSMQIAPKTVEIQIGTALKSLRKALAEWM